MVWTFGLVNGKLAEIFFNSKRSPLPYGFCYVKREDYKYVKLEYKNKKFKRILDKPE